HMRAMSRFGRPRPAALNQVLRGALAKMSTPATTTPRPWLRRTVYLGVVLVIAGLTVTVLALLINIRARKEEAKQHFVDLAGLDENAIDPAVWGRVFPRQYDGYKRTVD